MRPLFAASLSLLLVTPVTAQSERYELGRRLKAFEAEWEKHDSAAARTRSLALLPKVTTQFFALQLGEAGRTLDLAAFALQTDIGPAASRQWAWSLSAIPAARLVDGSSTELEVTIEPFYPVKGELPKKLELQLWFINRQVVTVRPEKFPVTVKVPLPPLGESRGLDRKLYFLADSGKSLRPVAVGVSQVADLEKRVKALGAATAGMAASIEKATVRSRAALLRAAIAGGVPATDLPYADLLTNAEAMLDGKPFYTPAKHGQFWLTVPVDGNEAVPCRVYIPKGLDAKKPVPIVVALHGAGTDENMFFESYGAGQTVKECERRGWALIAPRSGIGLGSGPPVAAIVEKLAARYPIDQKQVFVVGHSMGAGQVLAQAAGGKFAAVALLGGAGRAGNPRVLAAMPIFVGVGDKDSLALAGCRELNKRLADSGAKAVVFKEYPGIEHLVIVRAAIVDVFAMFDEVAGK